VALARALYQPGTDVHLFDDILASLDGHVAQVSVCFECCLVQVCSNACVLQVLQSCVLCQHVCTGRSRDGFVAGIASAVRAWY
jgi:hypothetical protein